MTSQSETGAVHKALQTSEQQFQLLVQGVKDYAIFMLDPQGRITTWNSGAERIKAGRRDHRRAFLTLLYGG
jgi:PAS domain-containing protein